jgi:hypothetical protein
MLLSRAPGLVPDPQRRVQSDETFLPGYVLVG